MGCHQNQTGGPSSLFVLVDRFFVSDAAWPWTLHMVTDVLRLNYRPYGRIEFCINCTVLFVGARCDILFHGSVSQNIASRLTFFGDGWVRAALRRMKVQ